MPCRSSGMLPTPASRICLVVRPVISRPVQQNAAGGGAAKAQKGLRQRRLSIALDARYAQHLAGADGKGGILYSGAATALHAEVLYLQHLFRPNGMGPAAPVGTVLPTIICVSFSMPVS